MAVGWAVAGMVTGITASITANVSHAMLPPAHAPAGWSPPAGALIAAGFWPLCLFLTLEVWTRVRWPRGIGWVLARVGGLGVVALVAALVSYLHMSGLLAAYGENTPTVWLGPLAVDGLMTVAALGLRVLSRPHQAEHKDSETQAPQGGAPEGGEPTAMSKETTHDQKEVNNDDQHQ